jgi:hypothetical protein
VQQSSDLRLVFSRNGEMPARFKKKPELAAVNPATNIESIEELPYRAKGTQGASLMQQ